MKNKKMYWITSVITVVLGIWGITQSIKIKNMENKIENDYARAFHELTGYVDDIDTLLQKSMLISSPSQMASISSELFRQSSAAKSSLGQLPVSEIQLENTEKFLSQVGDYTYVLSQKMINNNQVTEQEYKNLASLSQYASMLNDKLLQTENAVFDGTVKLGKIEKSLSSNLETVAEAANQDLISDFESVEKEFGEYPSLIYDGPFSEHIDKIKPVMLEGKKDVSQKEALEKAREFLGNPGYRLTYKGKSENNVIPAYSFYGENEGREINIDITVSGGFVAYFNESTDNLQEKIKFSQATENAKNFLAERGYSSLKESYYEKYDGIATINFAYCQGDVICYSDLIKVKVSLEDGSVIGCEMHGYLMNHHFRDFPQKNISAEEARNKINSHLQIDKTAIAYIPKKGEKEKLCYEFTGTHNKKHFIIYINAETGKEEDILMLLESENGILTA